MSLPDLLQWLRWSKQAGSLRLTPEASIVASEDEAIEVHFAEGRIVQTSTASVRTSFGSYLLFLTEISDEVIQTTLREARGKELRLGSMLVERGLLDEDRVREIISRKSREDILEALLWEKGDFLFHPQPPAKMAMIDLDIDSAALVVEATSRRRRWARLKKEVEAQTILRRRGGTSQPTDLSVPRLAAVLLSAFDGRSTVEDILAGLPHSRFEFWLTISELLAQDFLERADGEPDSPPSWELTRRLIADLEKRQEHLAALQLLQGVARDNPNERLVVEELVRLAQAFRAAVEARTFGPRDIPVAMVRDYDQLSIDRETGYILSRIDGRLSVAEISSLSPFDELRCLEIFSLLHAGRVIDFPNRAPSPVVEEELDFRATTQRVAPPKRSVDAPPRPHRKATKPGG